MAISGDYGIRRLMDQQMRFMGPGAKAWLRTKKYDDSNKDFSEMGFTYIPVASGAQVPTGYTDTLIDPPACIKLVSMHNLAKAVEAGLNLKQGARTVYLSHTFVLARMSALGYTDPTQVFSSPTVIGIVTENLILSIEANMPDYMYGKIVGWNLTCNANDIK